MKRPSRTCWIWASPPSNCCPCTRSARSVLGRAGPDELLGLQHDRLLRAAQRLFGRRPGQPGGQVAEFKAMVDTLRAGLEVVLDVVFNHTAEAGPDGPALCFRGIDNTAYYRTDPGNPGFYIDTTGCGNSLNLGDPIMLQLMMDSLRYWLTEMHATGSGST